MSNPDVAYPKLAQPAAFICTDKLYPSPSYDADEIAPTILGLTKNTSPSSRVLPPIPIGNT